ncbi:MAG: M48 family metallopeptidase [Sporolactobacillus sp.]
MKRGLKWFACGYGLYLALLAIYFFFWVRQGVPANAKGTAADPSQFMSAGQLRASVTINPWRYFLSFAAIPVDWAVYFFILVSGLGCRLRRLAERLSSLFLVQLLIVFAGVALIGSAAQLPFAFASYQLSLRFGISVQPLSQWAKDQAVSFGVDSLIGFIIVAVLFLLIRRKPQHWWWPAWLFAVPFVIFMMYVQPVLIDPLYNHFQSLPDSSLKRELLSLADQAGIPATNVYEVDKSAETRAMNAYVEGIGSHLRIVLWDTTVQHLSNKEVLFVMAHEMGHYVMHHVLWGMAAALLGMLVGLFLVAKLLIVCLGRWGAALNIPHPGDPAALPLLLLLFALISFAAEPLDNALSRQFERQADNYAIQLTGNRRAAISAFQKLSSASLAEVNPPGLVRFMQYDHPSMLERIEFLEKVKIKR